MEFINTGITFDGSGVQAGMKEASDAIKKGGEQIAGAAETAAAKSDFAFKSLTQAYRQTSKDAQFLAETQGISSKAFLEAATKAGQYKNKLDDVKLAVDALGADKPVLQSTLNLAQGIAGGFAAAQGAMALFGGKSKEVDEALKKVQGSLALLQGLQAVAGLADAWTAFSVVLKTNVIPALMTTRGILMTTGIGAIAAVVGYLAYKWVEESEAQERATEAHKKFLEAHFKGAAFDLETQRISIEALEDSLDKRQQLETNSYNKSLQELGQQRAKEEITIQQYNSRALALQKAHNSKLKSIRDEWNKEHPVAANIVRKETQIQEIGRNFSDGNIIPPLHIEGADMAQKKIEGVTGSLTRLQEMAWLVGDEIKSAFKDLIVPAFEEFGTLAGQSLAGAEVDFAKAGMKFIGSLAGTVGKGLIAMGVPLMAAITTFSEGLALVGAGTALMALSGAMGVAAGGGATAPSGGSSSGGYSGGGAASFQPQTSFFSATGILYGNDMLLAIQKSNQKMQRVK